MDEDEMFDKSRLCEMKMEVDWLAWRFGDEDDLGKVQLRTDKSTEC
jgi:hypothetical protein